jgi:hypothetical protein
MTNKTSIPRIGKVTMKAGANVSPLRFPKRDENAAGLMSHARAIADWGPVGNIVGWYIVAWDERGCYNQGYKIDAEKSPIGCTIAPSFVSDALRRGLIEGKQWS